MTVRVVTWNIHSCVGTDRNYDPNRTASVLRSTHADVIALQEVDWRKPNIDDHDQFEHLARSLRMTAIEGPNLEDHQGHYGNGLLTSLPVERVNRLELAHANREPRGLIDAHLRAGDRKLRVLVTHLGLRRRERSHQLRRIRDHLHETDPDAKLPTVLMGDLNEWIPRPIHRTHGLRTWFGTELRPRTFPSRLPIARLDRLLASPGLAVTRTPATTRDRRASDHRLVCAELELP